MTGLFGGPKTPAVKPPAPMPDESDPAIMEAKRKRIASMMGSGGRRATILTDTSGGAGAGGNIDYTKQTMG